MAYPGPPWGAAPRPPPPPGPSDPYYRPPPPHGAKRPDPHFNSDFNNQVSDTTALLNIKTNCLWILASMHPDALTPLPLFMQ